MNRRLFRRWAHIVLLLLFAVPVQPAVDAAWPAASVLSLSSSQLATTLTLGQQTELSLRVTNDSDQVVIPQLYEAQAATPAAAPPVVAGPNLPQQLSLAPAGERVDPQLSRQLALAPQQPARFLVLLAQQADLRAAYAIDDWAARGTYVYQALQAHAEQTQRGVRELLQRRGVPFQPLWIINGLLVEAGPAEVELLAARSEVAQLRMPQQIALYEPEQPEVTAQAIDGCSPDAPHNPICWNIRRVGAERVWQEFGVTGAGITIASLDTGIDFRHPAIVQQYRGTLSGGQFNHNYAWYDPLSGSAEPEDSGVHGSHTLGTALGAGGTGIDAPAIGVAPGASWIAARVCETTTCPEEALIAAAQWILAPTDAQGRNPRPELRPQIVNNSWAGDPNDPWYAGYTAAWRAAGIFPVFAAGNGSHTCGSVASPADYADVLAVGSTGYTDQISSFSRLGPGADGRIKPDLTAPGDGVGGIVSLRAGGGYQRLRGTSMATPHVAGAAALLMSANPALIGDYAAVYSALTASAVPLTATSLPADSSCYPQGVPNNVYGYGRLDAFAAVARVRVDLPWLQVLDPVTAIAPAGSVDLRVRFDAAAVPGPGSYSGRLQIYSSSLSQQPETVQVTLQVLAAADQLQLSGTLRDAANGRPLSGMLKLSNGASSVTGADGRFSLLLRPGQYEVTAQVTGYLPLTRGLTLLADQQLDLDLILAAPLAQLETTRIERRVPLEGTQVSVVLRNSGVSPLVISSPRIPAEPFVVTSSTQPGGPAGGLLSLPPDAAGIIPLDNQVLVDLPIGFSYPLDGRHYDRLSISANGILVFGPAAATLPVWGECLPAGETGARLIAALRMDYAAGGQIRYARLNDSFVVSWEQMPYRDGMTTATYSFQAQLFPDGRFVLRYGQLGTLPEQAAAGFQRDYTVFQSLGCGSQLGLASGDAVEFRPQPLAGSWIRLLALPQVSTLTPGQSMLLSFELLWVRPWHRGPYTGRLFLHTNDPQQPELLIDFQITPAAPASETRLPRLFNK